MRHLVGLAGIATISFSPIWVRLAAVSPVTAAFYRCAYALPILLLLWWPRRAASERSARGRRLALASGLLLAVDLSVWHRSIELIGAGLATVLGNTQVVWVGVAAWALHRERPTRLALLVVPVVFAGAALISGLGREDAYGEDPVAGTAFGLLTGLSFAGYLLLFRAASREGGSGTGALLDSTAGAAVGSLLLGVLDPRFDLAPSWPAHAWLVALAVGSQVFGWLLIAYALARLPALETSVLLLVQPMLSVLWAAVLFDERLSVVQWAGMALVLGGVAALSLKGSVEPAAGPATAAVAPLETGESPRESAP